METKNIFPFSNYDFWAYLTPGFVLIYVVDYSFGLKIFGGTDSDWDIAKGAMIVAAAYMGGHVIAGAASAILERRLVHKWLGRPRAVLLGNHPKAGLFSKLYPSYYESLPSDTRAKISTRAHAESLVDENAIFWRAYADCRTNPVTMERISTFQNLFGLARNLSITMLISAILLSYSAYTKPNEADYGWAGLALFVGIGMFLRYLKFYRHYTSEVLNTFAFSKGA